MFDCTTRYPPHLHVAVTARAMMQTVSSQWRVQAVCLRVHLSCGMHAKSDLKRLPVMERVLGWYTVIQQLARSAGPGRLGHLALARAAAVQNRTNQESGYCVRHVEESCVRVE